MLEKKEWQNFSFILREVLHLETSPVGICCLPQALSVASPGKVRICQAFLQAAGGKTLQIDRENNACFGAAWHLGFTRIKSPRTLALIKEFVVEGEKLFSSHAALDRLLQQMEEVPDNTKRQFLLCPLEKCAVKPQVVIFVVDAQATCRLLTLATFIDGTMPRIKIGGPTCRMALIYPLLTGELNISFYDYTSRRMCNVQRDKLLVSIPYPRLLQIMASIDKCTAGRAKLEYPGKFRQFLQRKLAAR